MALQMSEHSSGYFESWVCVVHCQFVDECPWEDMEKMTSVLQHDPEQPSKANIKTEDCSTQTIRAVNTDAVTEHEHAQDLHQTGGLPEQTNGNYQNVQCKLETTRHFQTTGDNISCTCDCNDTADIHDTNNGVTVTAKYGILGTDVSFPGEVKLIKDTCEFTVGVYSSLFSRGVINRPAVEELKNNIVRVLHNTNNNEEDIFTCNIPAYSQTTKDDCETPERNTAENALTQNKKYTCIKCGEDCTCTFSLKQHTLAPEDFKPYLCEKCTTASQTSDSTRQVNLKMIPDSGEGTEQNTAVNLPENGKFIPDELSEDNDTDYDTTQSKQTASQGHVNVITKKKYHLCKKCGKLFYYKSSLKKHMRVHTAERPYKCSQCEKTYKYNTELRVHMRIHTGERPYKCTYCDMAFTKKFILNSHLPTHTGERPYKCSQCGKTYKHIAHLIRHLRAHTGERPYKCTYCHKTFTIKQDLTEHIRTHTGEKPHKCTYCDKTFTQKSSLTGHIRTHTGEKPYKCTFCDTTFTQKHNLIYHIRTHTGEKPYTCTFCGKKISTKRNLKAHKLLHREHQTQ